MVVAWSRVRIGEVMELDFAYRANRTSQGSQDIQCKGSDSNCGHTVSVATTQFCPSMNVAVDDK